MKENIQQFSVKQEKRAKLILALIEYFKKSVAEFHIDEKLRKKRFSEAE
jgi:hypothetical protein